MGSLSKMSRSNLVGEIRREMRTKGQTNHLCYALGVILLVCMDAPLERGDELYDPKKSGGPRQKVNKNLSRGG
jgi:hypothetical protein